MTNVGSIYGDVRVDTSQAVAALQGLDQVAKSFASSMNRMYNGTAVAAGESTQQIGGLRQAMANAFIGRSNGIAEWQAQVRKATLFAKTEFKDVSRIVQGIFISKVVYGGLRQIRNAIQGVVDTAIAAEQAAGSFAVMLKNQEAAVALVEYVKEFAATTQFSFETATTAAKQLLAYGFKLNEMDKIMTTIGDAAAAMGRTDAYDRIAKALGQIRTKGKLATQEVLQLTEVGVPAYEILAEKLNLTKDQISNLGKAGIPATTAINALLTGMNERFGGAMELMENTVTGYMNNIKETFNAIMIKVIEPWFAKFKSGLKGLSQGMTEAWKALKEFGVGGMINQIFPPETATLIRQLVASFSIFGQSLKYMFAALRPFTDEILRMCIIVANIWLPIWGLIMNVMTAFARIAAQNAQIMNFLRIAIAGTVVALSGMMFIKTITTIIALLGKETLILAAGFGAVVAIVATLTGQGSKISGVLQGIGNSLRNLFGVKTGNILPPEINTPPKLEDFTNGMEDLTKATDDLGDSSDDAGKKAKKAAKNLMAFDEVFTLAEESAANAGSGKGKYDMSGLDFDMGDFSNVGNPFENFDFGIDTSGLDMALGDVNRVIEGIKNAIVGGFEFLKGYVPTALGFIKKAFDWLFNESALDIPLGPALVNLARTIKEGFVDVLIPIAGHLWSKFVVPVGKALGEYLAPILRDMVNIVVQWVDGVLDGLNKLVKGAYGLIAPFVEFLADVFVDVLKIIYDFWQKYAQDILDLGLVFINGIVDIFLLIGEKIIKPILEPFLKMLKKLWEGTLKDVLANVLDLVGLVIVAVKDLIEALIPVVAYIIDKLSPAVEYVFENMFFALGEVLMVVGDVINEILEAFKFLVSGISKALKGDFEGAVADFGLAFGKVGDAVKVIFDAIKGWIKDFIGHVTGTMIPALKTQFGFIGVIVEAAFKIVGGILMGIIEIMKGVVDFIVGVFTGDWDKAWGAVGNIFKGFYDIIADVINAVLTVLGDIVFFIIKVFGKAFEGVFNTVMGIVKYVGGVLESSFNFYKGCFESFVQYMTGGFQMAWSIVFGAIKFVLEGVTVFIDGVVKTIIDFFKGLISFLWDSLVTGWKNTFGAVRQVFKGFFDAVEGLVETVIQAFENIGIFLKGVLSLDFKEAWRGMKMFFEDIINGFVSIIAGFIKSLFGIADFITGVFKTAFQVGWNAIKFIFETVFNAFSNTIGATLKQWGDVLKWIGDTFKKGWETAWGGVKHYYDTVFKTMDELLGGFGTALKNFLSWIGNGFKTIWQTAWNAVKNLFMNIFNFGGIITSVKNLFVGMSSWISSTFKSGWQLAWNSVKLIFSNIFSFTGLISALKTVFSGIISWVNTTFRSGWSTAWNGVKSVFSNIFTGFQNIIKGPLNLAIDMINKAIDGINVLIRGANKVPGVNIPTVTKIPRLARGGIVSRHTLAEIGEGNRKEAVIPLERNTQGLQMIADMLAERMGNTGSGSDREVTVVLQIGQTQLGKVVIDSINQLQRKEGRVLLNI